MGYQKLTESDKKGRQKVPVYDLRTPSTPARGQRRRASCFGTAWRFPCNRRTPPSVERIMSEIVRCEVCGKIFNQSYLGSHKRLAHPKDSGGPVSPEGELRVVNKILSLYQQLSLPIQKQLRDRLARLSRSKSSPKHR